MSNLVNNSTTSSSNAIITTSFIPASVWNEEDGMFYIIPKRIVTEIEEYVTNWSKRCGCQDIVVQPRDHYVSISLKTKNGTEMEGRVEHEPLHEIYSGIIDIIEVKEYLNYVFVQIKDVLTRWSKDGQPSNWADTGSAMSGGCLWTTAIRTHSIDNIIDGRMKMEDPSLRYTGVNLQFYITK